MNLGNGFWMCKNRKAEIWTNLSGSTENITDTTIYTECCKLLKLYRSKYSNELDKLQQFDVVRDMLTNNGISEDDTFKKQLRDKQFKTEVEDNLTLLLNFFSEFSFSPNFRFVNTLTKKANIGFDAAKDYISNYFQLTDNSYYNQICEKMTSIEFHQIMDFLKDVQTKKSINNRFKLYYGAQGTGKTTLAMKEANNNCMVCHSAMLPSDLMEDFAFDEGKATFKPSQLYKAMTDGKTIVLDEINLLPFESLRFLQSILDGKSSFVYKGMTVNIAEGFQIIGTMNLQVNGMIYALPEPLVDRASDLREFKLTAEQLVGAIL